MPRLVAEGVTVRFGGNVALEGVDFQAEAGCITGLIGPNGAGKTTLFNVMTGLLRPDEGHVFLDGHSISRLGPTRRARRGIGRTFQRLELFSHLSVRENVRVAAEFRRGWARDRSDPAVVTDEVIGRLALDAVADARVGDLPTGLCRQVELARSLAIRPTVLLLDEPASGQDEHETEQLATTIVQLAAEGMAVVLVEHDLGLVIRVCDPLYVLDLGKVIAVGTPEEIQAHPEVLTAYIGGAAPAGTMNLLELRGVHAAYDRIEVLFGVDLALAGGSISALLGPNGAGKTTLLRIAAGLHRPSAGDVLLGGRSVVGADPVALARHGVCLIPEGRGVFPNLTVEENLRVMTFTGQPFDAIQERSFARFPKLADRRNQAAGTLSGGEQQMLALARALATDPAVLLLDELSMGLAPIVVKQLYELVTEIAAEGVAILVVEQFAAAVMGIADQAAVLVHGKVTLAGRPDEGVFERLSQLYLGGAVPAAG